jgi:hypothetical protein
MKRARGALGSSALALLLTLGCGTNAPSVPDDLQIQSSGCGAPDYPTDGLGTEVGDVPRNFCFPGYRAPDRFPASDRNQETIAFSDYYDPVGSKGVKLLLVNTAAIWCSACIGEHQSLPEHNTELAPRGLVILSTLFQDAKRDAATIDDLGRWIDSFHTNFPMFTDPEAELARYSPPTSAPLNMLVDPRNMKILRKYVGDQGDAMWPYVEAELAAREDQP